MCHGVVKWILEMLGIPKHTKVQQQQSLFYYFKEETFVSWSHLQTPKFYNTNLIVFFFVFFFSFHILTNNSRKKIFVIHLYKFSLLSRLLHSYNKPSLTLFLLLKLLSLRIILILATIY